MRYVLGVDALTWRLSDTQPDQWPAWVRTCGGGVFHTPAGLLVDAPVGTAIYGWLADHAGTIAGISLGSRYRCRLAATARHVHYPTLPALAPGTDAARALSALRDRLQSSGFAEVTVGSYDAQYTIPGDTPPRLEYVVQLPTSGDITSQLSTTHRRHVRRGDREGWTHRLLTGTEGAAAILSVQESTARRAQSLKRGFAPAHNTAWTNAVVPAFAEPRPAYGLLVMGAYRGETLLASILIGWGAERSFYLIGGSTPDGYRCGAAVWLHSRAMHMLAEHDIDTYNLGGTPLDAANESSPAHGLYRFKTGFGASPVERRGVRWELRPTHATLHRVLTRLLRRDASEETA